jgi:osomolarity two-component system sensor histidine kinase NIK1
MSAFLAALFNGLTADDQVNRMCQNLTTQVRSIATVTTAVARVSSSSPSRRPIADNLGRFEQDDRDRSGRRNGYPEERELLRSVSIESKLTKQTVNRMVRQLTTFATEVTRVALEVGTQGILGGQAVVEGVEGVWEDLTTNVNVRKPNPAAMVTALRADLAENGWKFD